MSTYRNASVDLPFSLNRNSSSNPMFLSCLKMLLGRGALTRGGFLTSNRWPVNLVALVQAAGTSCL